MDMLLIVCTIVGGIAGIGWIVEKLSGHAISKAFRSRAYRAPNIDANSLSLVAYVQGSPRPKELDRRIATERGLPLRDLRGDYVYLEEKVRFLGVKTIRDLDGLVKRYSDAACRLSHYLTPEGGVPTAFGVDLVLEIHALESGGLEKLVGLLTSLRYSAGSRGVAEDLKRAYDQIKDGGA